MAGIRHRDPARNGAFGRTSGRRGSQRIVPLSGNDDLLGSGSGNLSRRNHRAHPAGSNASVRAASPT